MASPDLSEWPYGRSGSFRSIPARWSLRTFPKRIAKGCACLISVVVMLPFAALSWFGRIPSMFQLFAHLVALAPGLAGDYLRVAYYAMTLTKCSLYSRISFGSFFAQSSVRMERSVYIGAYCVIASCNIGERTQIASHVQIFGGAHLHGRDEKGHILPADASNATPITIGADCWVGASAIVMADVGPGTTIGAGAVVTQPMPAHVVAVGNPARVVKQEVCDPTRGQ
jgi:virginiamycin A acetyltransferase